MTEHQDLTDLIEQAKTQAQEVLGTPDAIDQWVDLDAPSA